MKQDAPHAQKNTNKDCLTCEFGHFLLLVDGKVRCAQCPDYTYWNDIPTSGAPAIFTAGDNGGNKNCLDCYANPSSWQYTRRCTRKLKVITDLAVPSFVIFELPKPEIYSIKAPSGPGQPYTTEMISGCEVQENSEFQNYEEQGLWRYSAGEVNVLLSVEDTSASKIKTLSDASYTCPADSYFTSKAT